MNNSLREFDTGEADVALDDHVSAIEAWSDEMSEEHISRLWAVLQNKAQEVKYGPEFNMKEEVEMQLLAVHAMRQFVLPGGKIRPGTPIREVKEVVTASSTLLSTLMKSHREVLSFERTRSMEEATLVAIRTLPEETQELFFSELKQSLAAIE
jgi:hypothetical protein